MAYLKSWVLIAPTIASRFLLNFCPFLLEVIRTNNTRSLFFQAHFKLTCKFFPLMAAWCVFPFELLVEKGANWFKENISKKLYYHSFSSIIFDLSFDLHWTHLWSYVGPNMKASLLSTQPMIFWVSFKHFFHCIAHLVGLPPSFNLWFVTLHLWLIFGSYGDSHSSVHSC